MPGRSFRLVTIAGIPVGVSPWWLLIVVLLSWSLGSVYFPETVDAELAPAAAYGLGLLSTLLLFGSILLHEFGHALVARGRGVEVEAIDLWLLGGVAKMRGEAHRPGDELRYALAGPAVTLVIVAVFAVASLLVGDRSTVLGALVAYQLVINVAILGFNMIPAFPLDGGRVLRALLWARGGDSRRATRIAATIGRVFGAGMVAFGLLTLLAGAPGGLWFAIVGGFIVAAAASQAQAVEIEAALSGMPAEALMSSPVDVIAADTTVERAIAEHFVAERHTAFPVVAGDGAVLGVITLQQVSALAPERRASTSVLELADDDPQLLTLAGEDVAVLLQRPAFQRVGRLVVTGIDGAPLGLLSITDVQRALRAARLAQPEASPTPR